jgi:MFS-type transporter involved in bile tolerance (Atg22 family)
MYAFMALAGDVGCSSGPSVVGFVANAFEGNLKTGLSVAIIFPVVMLLGLACMKMRKR